MKNLLHDHEIHLIIWKDASTGSEIDDDPTLYIFSIGWLIEKSKKGYMIIAQSWDNQEGFSEILAVPTRWITRTRALKGFIPHDTKIEERHFQPASSPRRVRSARRKDRTRRAGKTKRRKASMEAARDPQTPESPPQRVARIPRPRNTRHR